MSRELSQDALDYLWRMERSVERFRKFLELNAPYVITEREIDIMQTNAWSALQAQAIAGAASEKKTAKSLKKKKIT